jgi:hypothetical protein
MSAATREETTAYTGRIYTYNYETLITLKNVHLSFVFSEASQHAKGIDADRKKRGPANVILF